MFHVLFRKENTDKIHIITFSTFFLFSKFLEHQFKAPVISMTSYVTKFFFFLNIITGRSANYGPHKWSRDAARACRWPREKVNFHSMNYTPSWLNLSCQQCIIAFLGMLTAVSWSTQLFYSDCSPFYPILSDMKTRQHATFRV